MSTVTIFGFTFDPAASRRESDWIAREARSEMLRLVTLCPLPPGVERDDAVVWIAGTDGAGAPDFQFDGSGRPRPSVAAANRLLGAGDDPWGVLSWWLNDWFVSWGTVCPVSLIGTPDEALIEDAARHLLRDPD